MPSKTDIIRVTVTSIEKRREPGSGALLRIATGLPTPWLPTLLYCVYCGGRISQIDKLNLSALGAVSLIVTLVPATATGLVVRCTQ
jgi:hypothetical protein